VVQPEFFVVVANARYTPARNTSGLPLEIHAHKKIA